MEEKNVTHNQMQDLFENLGKVLKEPTVAEARKIRQEEILEKRKFEARRDEAKLASEDRERKIDACRQRGHAKHDAKRGAAHAWRGNLNSDGCIRPQCISCNHQLPPFKAPDTIKSGSSVNEWFERMPNLNEKQLIQWSKDSNPEWWANEAKKAAKRKEFTDTFRPEPVGV
jgi:hypothetical protein